MFQNRIVQAVISDLTVTAGERTGDRYSFSSIVDFASLICNTQWISPILVNHDTNTIVAGRRRFTAINLLNAVVNGKLPDFVEAMVADGLPWANANTQEALIKLNQISTCQVDSWNNWSKIPAQLGSNFTDSELKTFELLENIGRKDISWQEKAQAIYVIHANELAANSDWSNTKTGNLIGLDHSTIAKNLKVWRFMMDKPSPEIKLIIDEAPTLNSAAQSLARYTSRRQDDVVTLAGITAPPKMEKQDKDLPSLAFKPGPAAGEPQPYYLDQNALEEELQCDEDAAWEAQVSPPPPLSLGERLLTHGDFHEWAANYTGPTFNFLHCDFPYGINFNTGAQTSTVKNKLAGDYDDSPEVYWELLDTLVTHRDKLISDSAHIMFWYSQNMEYETIQFFTDNFPDAALQRFKLIWHCSDGDGIVPDPQRYGRRTYETALVLTFGDRHIVTPKALSFATPRGSATRHHRSQKPQAVLAHFMSMFVDDASSVLDPTAGSGTSLLTAHQLNAKRIVGIEKEEQTYQTALGFLNKRDDIIAL